MHFVPHRYILNFLFEFNFESSIQTNAAILFKYFESLICICVIRWGYTMDDFESYDVITVIGSGSFGTCYKVKHKLTLKEFVWKAVNYDQMSERKKQSVVSEVNVLSKLRHPNIIRYYDHIIHKKSSTMYIIMEYCGGGNLLKVVQQCLETSQYLNEIFIWRTMYQIASALHVCHSQCTATILHEYIKPANVFLDAENNVKLGDFNLTKILEKYDEKCDIWSLGCLIYEACALKPPFIRNDLQNLSMKIKQGVFNRIPIYYSEDLHNMVEFMLNIDSVYQPTIDIVMRHPTVVLKSCKDITSIYQPLPTTILSSKFKQTTIIKEQNLNKQLAENLQNRLENIRNREVANKQREEKLNERERILNKKEKKLALMERLAKEKVIRANLYLKRSKENKSQDRIKPSIEELLDTSNSADPGDTSILPTSVKIDEENIVKPKGFVRSKSERRVHFTAQKVFESNSEGLVLKEYNFYKDEPRPEPVKDKHKMNYFKKSLFKITQSNSSIGSSSNNSEASKSTIRPVSWTEENKRCAFSLLKLMNSECDKENLRSKIIHTKM